MRKRMTNKKSKIPKLTEAEYAEYISALKSSDVSARPVCKEKKALSIACKNTEKSMKETAF